MAYLGLALILAIACLIQHFDDKMCDKQNETIEKLHEEAYAWIDENTSTPAVARERKAQIDTMINNCVEYKGRKYTPKELRQVASRKEREARNKAEINGEQYISDDMALSIVAYSALDEPSSEELWAYMEHTDDERREHYIKALISRLGISREDAERRADKFYSEVQ